MSSPEQRDTHIIPVTHHHEGPVEVEVRRGAIGRVLGAFSMTESERRDAGVVTPAESQAVEVALGMPDTRLPKDFSQNQIALANQRAASADHN